MTSTGTILDLYDQRPRIPLTALRVLSIWLALTTVGASLQLADYLKLLAPTLRQLPALLGHGSLGVAAFAAIAASLVVFTPLLWWLLTTISTFLELSGELWDGVIDSAAWKKISISLPKVAISAKATLFLALFWITANLVLRVR
jgi:hypothetical protein